MNDPKRKHKPYRLITLKADLGKFRERFYQNKKILLNIPGNLVRFYQHTGKDLILTFYCGHRPLKQFFCNRTFVRLKIFYWIFTTF